MEENFEKTFGREIQHRNVLFFNNSNQDHLRDCVQAGLNDLNGPTLLVILTKDASAVSSAIEISIAKFPLEFSCGMKLMVDNFPLTDGQLIFLSGEQMNSEHVILLGLEKTVDLSSYKLLAICRVNPLPLGFVCIKTAPDTRSGSLKIRGVKNVNDWMNILGKIPWSLVSRKSTCEHIVQVEGDYVDAGQPFGNMLSNQETSITMCDMILSIGEETVRKHSDDAAVLYSLHACRDENVVKLIIGVTDLPIITVGISPYIQPLQDACTVLLSHTFPRVVRSDITMIRYPVRTSCSSQSDIVCSQDVLVKDLELLSRIVRILGGDCNIIQCSDPEMVAVVATKERVDTATQYIRSSSTATEQKSLLEHLIDGQRDSWEAYLSLLWSKIDGDEYAGKLEDRIVVELQIKLPDELMEVIFDPSLVQCKIWDHRTQKPVSIDGEACWLRCKGLASGALRSKLYEPLLSTDFMRVVIAAHNYLDRVRLSLRTYLDGANSHIDYCNPESNDLPNGFSLGSIVIITTSEDFEAAKQFAVKHRLYKHKRLSFLVFVVSLKNYWLIPFEEHREYIADVAILQRSFECSQVDEEAVSSSNAGYLEGVVPVPAFLLGDQSSVQNHLSNWIFHRQTPSWELMKMGLIARTPAIDMTLRLLRDKKPAPGNLSFIGVHKRYPGSGSTALLKYIGFSLQQSVEATCFEISTPQACDVDQFIQNCRGWVVLLLEEGVVLCEARLAEQRAKLRNSGLAISIVTVNAPMSNRDVEINPYLPPDVIRRIASSIKTNFRAAAEGIDKYVGMLDSSSLSREDCHIYILMLAATTGKYRPTQIFLRECDSKLSPKLREDAMVLAFLSFYCPKVKVSVEHTGALIEIANEMLSVTKNGLHVSFLHPQIAMVYIEKVLEARKGALCKACFYWASEKASSLLDPIYEALFCDDGPKGNMHNFPLFIAMFQPEEFDELEKISSLWISRDNLQKILLSRSLRIKCQQYETAIELAEEAVTILSGTD